LPSPHAHPFLFLIFIAQAEDKRSKFALMYDNGEITYKYKFAHPKHRSKELWYFRVPVSVPRLEIMCTDLRVPSMVKIPFGQVDKTCRWISPSRRLWFSFFPRI
jgi:hypothetical protein